MFKTVLAAVDGSEGSNKALAAACDIAQKYGSDLYIVHAPQLETAVIAGPFGGAVISETPEAIQLAGKAVLEAAVTAAKAAGITPKDCHQAQGAAADEILTYAALQDADLIVMGRRGLSGIASLFLGSVSQSVSHGAKCTVMTIHV